MILRSVVGKLWITIILLVSFILILLSFFLNEKVEVTYLEDQKNGMCQLAREIQNNLTKMDHECDFYLSNVIKTARLFNTYTIILDKDQVVRFRTQTGNLSKMDWRQLLGNKEIESVSSGKQIIEKKENVFFLATPYYLHGKIQGTILLYQLQDLPTETDIKKWIFYSALIGIILTTIVAFFLSNRITQPLIQLKKAAERMALGEFSTRVPLLRQKDEMADLSATFNKMADQLEDLISQLSQEKEHLSSILESMSDGVITFDISGKVILTNSPADIFLSLWPASSPPLENQVFQVIKSHNALIVDLSEDDRTWSVVFAPLYDRDKVRGVVAVLREVTKERRLDKLRKDFVANVSHELRTPLSMLQGYSEALMDDIVKTKKEQKEIAQLINEESKRMGRLVSELLDLACMESEEIHLNLTCTFVPEFLERIVTKFKALSRSEGVHLSSQIEPHYEPIFMDKDKLEQVFTNLIANSFRYTQQDDQIIVKAYQDENDQYFEVKDTGSGIKEEDLPYIFERFYKGDKARTRNDFSGTGLGLSIVKHIVKAHNGKVSVRSHQRQGTTFIIKIPKKNLH